MPEPSSSQRSIVSNTGPFISLEKVTGGFSLLRSLYDRVFIPPQVLSELGPVQSYLKDRNIENLVIVEAVVLPEDSDLDLLDAGEQYAISLALKKQLPLLIEERLGRDIAESKGLKISGIGGQIVKAKEMGILDLNEAYEKLKELWEKNRINTTIYEQLKLKINSSSK
jgi:predicted nucleic acid-binding protein